MKQVIQSQWKAIGVESVIKNETPRILFGQTTQKREYDGALMFAWLSAPRNIPKTTLHSEMIPNEDNGWSGQNYAGFKDDETDKIIDDLEVTCEADANQALWDRIQMRYAETLPALPLYFRSEAHFVPSSLLNFNATGHQYPSTYWSEYWQISEK